MNGKCLNNGLLIVMDIRVKPEYDGSLSFSDLIRESKKTPDNIYMANYIIA